MENQSSVQSILQEVKTVIKGKDQVVEKVLIALLAKGHILIEDIPGVGKTTMALAFSRAMSLDYKRMQFTPDVLPSDVVGFTILTKEQTFEYKQGAVLCNLFLADEVNRTSSKTQSALLEVMEEGKVTVDGTTRPVPKPFNVIATQNPEGSAGTQLLPESQLDRFMIKLSMGYPDIHEEINIIKGKQTGDPLDDVQPVVSTEEILLMQEQVSNVFIHDVLYAYITALVSATRKNDMVSLGASPRGSIALTAIAKARAYVMGRDYVLPEDISTMFPDVISHRLVLNPKARVGHIKIEDVINQILERVPAPKL